MLGTQLRWNFDLRSRKQIPRPLQHRHSPQSEAA